MTVLGADAVVIDGRIIRPSEEIRHFWENGGRWPAERSPAADEP